MVYWKLNRRYQVGTDIWEPRTSVKHFSSLSWCISWRKHHFELHSQVAPTTDGVKERSSSSPHVFILSSVPRQVLQTATKYSFGLIWCCCFTDLALAASTEKFDSWQHVYRRRGRPDRSFSQSLAHRLSSLLVSSWTEMHRLHIKYDPMSAFSACDNPKTANANNQFFFLISLQKVERIWCLDGTIKQGRSQAAQSKDHRKIKELQYRSD